VPSNINERRPPRGFPGSSFRYTPLEHVKTVVISFVQGLFSAAPVGSYKWDPDDSLTEIIIRDENPINVGKYGARPAINFTLGNTSFYHVGMDDLHTYNFATGRKEKGMLVPGVITANVCSRVDNEALNLGWVVAEHVWVLRELMLKEGFFDIGRGLQVGPPSPPGSVISTDQGDEWYCVAVSIPWQFARRASFTPLGQSIVAGIEQQLSLNVPKRVESDGWAAIPGRSEEIPVSISTCQPDPFSGASDARGGTPDPTNQRDNPLPIQPHPLNPAQTVTVRTIRPYRTATRFSSSTRRGAALPIKPDCK